MTNYLELLNNKLAQNVQATHSRMLAHQIVSDIVVPKTAEPATFLSSETIRSLADFTPEAIKYFKPECNILRDDVLFLYGHLKAPLPDWHQTLKTYRQKWLEGIENEPLDHKKQNRGRFKANTWLRLYLK